MVTGREDLGYQGEVVRARVSGGGGGKGDGGRRVSGK